MDLNTIAEELFAKIRGRFPNVTIGDEEGNVTTEPAEARFFEFTFKNGNKDKGKISISLDDKDGVVIMYNEGVASDDLSKKKWYDFLREMRTFSKKRMLNFDVRNITKSNLEKRDYKYLAKNSGDSSMNESKLYGTSKLSYQDVDSARIVIRHTESVNTELPSGRTRNIGAIYIESAEGERFKYPFRHLAGARAMARHVAEGGTTYDEFGSHIVELSEELSKLRKFKNYMGRSKVMAESLADYMGVVHERIGTVKKRIDRLQKKNYYQEAFETFEKPVFEEIPEDVKENWIDQLTIRQFNEELKDVFPYIYKLIGEHTRVKELGPDDVERAVTEAAEKIACLGCDAVSTKAAWKKNNGTCPKCKKSSKGVAESAVTEAPFGDLDDERGDWKRDTDRDWRDQEKGMAQPDDEPDEIAIVKPRLTKAFAKKGIKVTDISDGYYMGTFNVVDSKGREWNYDPVGDKIIPADEVDVDEGSRQWSEKKSEVGNTSKDRWESTIESTFDKLMGEWGDENESCCDGCDAGGPCEYDGGVEESPKYDLSDNPENELQKNKRKLRDLKKLKAEVWGDADKQTMREIQKKEIELVNNIKRLQAAAESAQAEAGEQEEQQTPLSEFILSFYDRTTGSFPKGETAVLTMVEKDYGDEFIEPAKTFIERVNHTFEQYASNSGSIQEEPVSTGSEEFDRIRKLAGL